MKWQYLREKRFLEVYEICLHYRDAHQKFREENPKGEHLAKVVFFLQEMLPFHLPRGLTENEKSGFFSPNGMCSSCGSERQPHRDLFKRRCQNE